MRRRSRLSFGPKRKSFRLGPVKYNTKSGIPTSASVGGKAWRINASARGVRTTSRIPGTRIRVHNSLSSQTRRQAQSAAHSTQEPATKRGCVRGCFPALALVVVAGVIAMVALSFV